MYKEIKLYITLILLTIILTNLSCTAASSTEGVKDKKAAPDFVLRNLKGEEIRLSQFRNKKNILLVFWATWCPHCVSEVPELKEIYEKYKDQKLKLLSIDIQESHQKVSSFVKNYSIPYTVLLDTDGKVASAYGVRGIPHQVIIDKKGVILYQGPRPYGGLMSLVSKLIEKKR